MPDEIIIREAEDNAYIYKATLKVMLEEDYLNQVKGQGSRVKGGRSMVNGNAVGANGRSPLQVQYDFKDPRLKELNVYSSQLIRELIIPKLTQEINISKRYASLRQVYYSLILAQWFKRRWDSHNASVGTEYYSVPTLIDSKNLANLTSQQSWDKDAYFNAYRDNFQKGEYNIKEPRYTPFGQTIRTYFSGGVNIIAQPTGIISGQGSMEEMRPYMFAVGARHAMRLQNLEIFQEPEEIPRLPLTPSVIARPAKPAEAISESSVSVGTGHRPVRRTTADDSDIPTKVLNDNAKWPGALADTRYHNLPDAQPPVSSPAAKAQDTASKDGIEDAGESNQIIHSLLNGVVREEFIVPGLLVIRDSDVFAKIVDIASRYTLMDSFSDGFYINRDEIAAANSAETKEMYEEIITDLEKLYRRPIQRAVIVRSNAGRAVIRHEILHDYIEIASQMHKREFGKLSKAVWALEKKSEFEGVFLYLTYGEGKPEHFKEFVARFFSLEFADPLADTDEYPRKQQKQKYRYLLEHMPDNIKKMFYEIGLIWPQGPDVHLPAAAVAQPPASSLAPSVAKNTRSTGPAPPDAQNGGSKPGKGPSTTGGIDLRKLPAVNQAISNLGLGDMPLAQLNRINLDDERLEIERLVDAGIMPSAERVKECALAALSRGGRDKNKVTSCVMDILRLEEEQYCPADPILKDILIVLESQ